MDISGELAEAAQTDLCLPYSLICDTWDRVEMSGKTDISREEWLNTLKWSIEAYKAFPLEYRFNDKALIDD